MLFRDQSKPELVIEVPSNSKPKAVVVLLGWFGSKIRHVRKYSELYDERGCATISGTLDNRSVLLLDIVKIDELAMLVAKEAAKLLREHNGVPLIFHVFSNGGGIPLQRMEQIMEQEIAAKGADYEDYKLVRERFKLGAQVFDSAPAFPDMKTFRGAVDAALPNPIVRSILFLIVAFFYQSQQFLYKLQGKQGFQEAYWSHWEQCPAYTPTQAFVYSTADTITRHDKLDELVKTRSEKGVQVMVKRFDNTLHVQHMRLHKAEYCGLVDKVLMNCR